MRYVSCSARNVVVIVKEELLVLHEIAVAGGADLVIIHALSQLLPGWLETMPEIHMVSTSEGIVRILSDPHVRILLHSLFSVHICDSCGVC
jgi:hypothetical protein